MALSRVAVEFTPGTTVHNVPANCTGWGSLTAVGPGGAGGVGQPGSAAGAGGGGGGGETVAGQRVKLTPGGTFTVVVPSGGVGNSVALASFLPVTAQPGSITVGSAVEYTQVGGFGAGNGGGNGIAMTLGPLRLMPGAGGARGGDGGNGGMGGGPRQWQQPLIAHGNMGTRSGGLGGGSLSNPTPGDSNCFWSGGGAGAGSAGSSSNNGGDAAAHVYQPAVSGGAGSGISPFRGGGGAGTSSIYGTGGTGGAADGGSGADATGLGGGGGGDGGAAANSPAGGAGADGYALLIYWTLN